MYTGEKKETTAFLYINRAAKTIQMYAVRSGPHSFGFWIDGEIISI